MLVAFALVAFAHEGAAESKGPEIQPVGLLQLWGTAYDMDESAQADATGYGDPEDDIGVKVKRARLGVKATWGGFRLGLVGGVGAAYDGFSTDETAFSLYQASLGWEGVTTQARVAVRAGVMDTGFSREGSMSAGELTFQERGLASEHLIDVRSTGVAAEAGSVGRGITGTLGVYNSGYNPFGDDNAGKTFVGRIDGKLGKRNVNVLWDTRDDRTGVGVGLGAAGAYTIDVATSTLAATADVVLRAGPVSALAEGSFGSVTPTATDIAASLVLDPTTRLGATGEVNVAIGRFQPAARVSWYSDSSVGSWTQVLGGVVMHTGLKGMPDLFRIGAGYVLRVDAPQNDTVRVWAQARI